MEVGTFYFPKKKCYTGNMKKIMLIGSCGAGKSTFAKRLHEILAIDIIHLDQYYWKPNWIKTEKDEWQNKISKLLEKDEWIMDGNYRSTMDLRLAYADTIIWLDFSPMVCLWRILKRRLKNNRVDEITGCRERISFELLKWILWKFPKENKKDIVKKIELQKNKQNLFILKSNEELALFLDKLKNDLNKL